MTVRPIRHVIWDDARISTLTELWEAGYTAAQIGRKMDISRNAVIGKAHRLGLPPRPSPIKRAPAPVYLDHRCQFIEGDPQGHKTEYCDKPPVSGSPYCEQHHKRCYRGKPDSKDVPPQKFRIGGSGSV